MRIRMREPVAVGSPKRDAAGSHELSVGFDFALDFVESAEVTGDAHLHVELRAGCGWRGNLEWPESCHAQAQLLRRARTRTGRCACRQPSGLRDHLDENHSRHDRLVGKVTVEEEVVSAQLPPCVACRLGTSSTIQPSNRIGGRCGRRSRRSMNGSSILACQAVWRGGRAGARSPREAHSAPQARPGELAGAFSGGRWRGGVRRGEAPGPDR
jgi:hypothetical protein